VIVSFLNFLWLLSLFQDKESDKCSSFYLLKDKSLADLGNLRDPNVLAEEIAENLESEWASFQQVLSSLRGTPQSAGQVSLFIICKALGATADCFVVPPRNDVCC
jgi:hypothetical protein